MGSLWRVQKQNVKTRAQAHTHTHTYTYMCVRICICMHAYRTVYADMVSQLEINIFRSCDAQKSALAQVPHGPASPALSPGKVSMVRICQDQSRARACRGGWLHTYDVTTLNSGMSRFSIQNSAPLAQHLLHIYHWFSQIGRCSHLSLRCWACSKSSLGDGR